MHANKGRKLGKDSDDVKEREGGREGGRDEAKKGCI